MSFNACWLNIGNKTSRGTHLYVYFVAILLLIAQIETYTRVVRNMLRFSVLIRYFCNNL